jgi:hypothetical protein
MMDETKPDPLDSEIINFSFTVGQVNTILQILGNAPYLASAGLISLIQTQGQPQFQAILAKQKVKDEPKTAS